MTTQAANPEDSSPLGETRAEAATVAEEPTFEELAHRVAYGADGQAVLSLPNPPETAFGKFSRLGMLFLVSIGLMIGLAYVGYEWYRKAYPFFSAHHEADLEYQRQHAAEMEMYVPPPEPLLRLPAATIVKNEYTPSSRTVTIKIEYVTRQSVSYVGRYFHTRWEALPDVLCVGMGDARGYSVAANKRSGGLALTAEVGRDSSGYTRARVEMQRKPYRSEIESFGIPDFLPRPPKGAITSSVGGGAPGTELGRIYQIVVPGAFEDVVRYYTTQFSREGWELMGNRKSTDPKSLTFIYRKASKSISMQLSPLLLSSKPNVIVDLVPF